MNYPTTKGELVRDYPLRHLNTWKIGGTAEAVFWPESTDELRTMMNWCREVGIPVWILGRGSNVLLPDQELKGLVIVTTQLNRLTWRKEAVTVEAGVSLMQCAREAASRGLKGLEFACGIPGTVGAAIVMNAGAYGQEIGKRVLQVTVLTPQGNIRTIRGDELRFFYRGSSLIEEHLLVLEANLALEPDNDKNLLQATIQEYMQKRKANQPLEYPNAGSVFRNPPGDLSGRLIETAGWKGRQIGGAQVSEKHANFIVNRGEATAANVLQLIQAIQEDIQKKFGVTLQTEIKVIGEIKGE